MGQTESSTLSSRLPDAAAADRSRYAGMMDEGASNSPFKPRMLADTAYSSYAVTNATWHLPLASFAISRPDMPGIWISRNMMSGECALSALTASMPSSASAQITSSGHSRPRTSLSSARRIGSSLGNHGVQRLRGAPLVHRLVADSSAERIRNPPRTPSFQGGNGK